MTLFIRTVIGFFMATQVAYAKDEAPFYAEKQVKMIIGVPPGGGYDIYARLLVRHMGAYLPGKPLIISQQMPGAESLVATNYLYNVAPRDGTVIGSVVNGILFEPLLSGKGNVNYDIMKFSWIGNLNKEVNLLTVWHTVPVNSFQDIQKRETILAATVGGSGTSNTFPKILNEMLGAKIKVISGYSSSAQGFLAMQRGEVEGRGMYWSSLIAAQRDLYERGEIKILLQTGLEKHPDLPNVPFALDLARNEDDRALMELLFSSLTLGRPIFAPPDIPAQRLDELRAAFDLTVKDERFQTDAARMKIEANSSSGPEVEHVLRQVYATPPAIVKRAREIMN